MELYKIQNIMYQFREQIHVQFLIQQLPWMELQIEQMNMPILIIV